MRGVVVGAFGSGYRVLDPKSHDSDVACQAAAAARVLSTSNITAGSYGTYILIRAGSFLFNLAVTIHS